MNNKRILAVALAFVMLISNAKIVSATTISEAKNQKKAAEKKLESINDDIENLEEEMGDLEEEAAEYQQQLVDLLVTIQIINSDIESKEEDIVEAQQQYEGALARQEYQKRAMNMRIKYMYEKGNTSYMQVLLEARKYADAVNKASYSEKLYEYDRYQLYLYEQTKQDVLDMKNLLEEDLMELEEIKADSVEQEMELQALIDEYSEAIDDFDDKLAEAKNKASKYKDEIKKQSDSIRALEEEEARKKAEEAKKKAEEAAKKKAAEEAKRKAAEEAAKEAASKAENSESSESSESNESSGDSGSESSDSGNSGSSDSGSSSGSSGGSAKGQEIANFAVQFVGNPYVAGGTSLTEGADCSGFTQAVYSNFGVSLPRTSGSQALVGTSVSYAEAAPGDIIYYGGHVGIYIGNGLIVHASTQATGIKISSALYRSIISVRRIV